MIELGGAHISGLAELSTQPVFLGQTYSSRSDLDIGSKQVCQIVEQEK